MARPMQPIFPCIAVCTKLPDDSWPKGEKMPKMEKIIDNSHTKNIERHEMRARFKSKVSLKDV